MITVSLQIINSQFKGSNQTFSKYKDKDLRAAKAAREVNVATRCPR
jgi:hypothetical protein